ncbi:group 1 glycosyl transferase [Flavobacterium hydrophilum]|uniref:Group 1 glycosyl transferase n=1 Tax=Flavobacterium hydrophilum TaxID=2211445 RepID=A0A2V4C1D5_9FLAO|nr:group 1 glycosyl transferase [Flavobacterium hydrophilum]
MYKTVKLFFRLKILALKLKKEGKKIDFLNNLKHDSYVLIVDTRIPEFNKDSGSRRLTEIIKLLLKNNIGVFLMADFKEYRYKSDYIEIFKEMGVVVYEPSVNDAGKLITKNGFLKIILPKVSFAWLHRPEIFEKYYPLVESYKPKTKVFFDMVDFHYLRFKRESELMKEPKIMEVADKYLNLELDNCKKADKIIVISDLEGKTLKDYYNDESKIITIGNIHQYIKNENSPSFENRKDLLFIGGFDHKPNVDAVSYLHEEIMPLLWESQPEISISIIGSNPPDSILKLHSEKFKIVGYVKEVAPYFLSSRIFVAPLRYGAGIKGKIGQSIEFGLPLVTTNIGAEGFDFAENAQYIVGNTSKQIVDNILLLYQNKEIWNKISSDSEKVIEPFSSHKIEQKILTLIK